MRHMLGGFHHICESQLQSATNAKVIQSSFLRTLISVYGKLHVDRPQLAFNLKMGESFRGKHEYRRCSGDTETVISKTAYEARY
jgi:hypothetical protein